MVFASSPGSMTTLSSVSFVRDDVAVFLKLAYRYGFYKHGSKLLCVYYNSYRSVVHGCDLHIGGEDARLYLEAALAALADDKLIKRDRLIRPRGL